MVKSNYRSCLNSIQRIQYSKYNPNNNFIRLIEAHTKYYQQKGLVIRIPFSQDKFFTVDNGRYVSLLNKSLHHYNT